MDPDDHRTELGWAVYLIAGVIAVIITGVTISWYSWKTATRNQVDAIRYKLSIK